MTSTGTTRLEDGWLGTTPVDDSVFRRFVHNQAQLNELLATSGGGRVHRTDEVALVDGSTPVAYFNQAMLLRPILDIDDPTLDTVDQFYAGAHHATTLLSLWPTPDLRRRGWELVGHPMLVLRGPGPVTGETPSDCSVTEARSDTDLALAERVVIDGYPFEQARALPPGRLFPGRAVDAGLDVRIASIDGDAVAVGNRYIAHGIVNLCLAATVPAGRRRGAWTALVRARIGDAPDLCAVAFTSDDSRPGFVALGFQPLTRLTLWQR